MAAFRPVSFCASLPVILSPPIVILSEAKNLPSRLRGMAERFFVAPRLRMTEGGKTAPQNDRGGENRASE